MPDFGKGQRSYKPRRPYGDNEGDIYLMGDAMQKSLQEDDPELVGIIEMMRNKETGKVEEHFYTTKNPDIIARAKRGNRLFLAGAMHP
jgi:hypothetical protein